MRYKTLLFLRYVVFVFPAISMGIEKDLYLTTPEGVVQNFCQLDAEGMRLGGDTWKQSILPLVTWREEAGDMIEIIDHFLVGKTTLTDSSAVIPVEYKYIGSTDFITFSEPTKRKAAVTFKILKKMGNGK